MLAFGLQSTIYSYPILTPYLDACEDCTHECFYVHWKKVSEGVVFPGIKGLLIF